MKNKIFKLFIALLIFTPILVAFNFSSTNAEKIKQYKRGATGCISNSCYVFANNESFIEILKLSSSDELRKVAEIHGLERINDLFFSEERGVNYLYVLTGRYVVKYNIDNVFFPEIEIKRDLYEYRRGKAKIGYMQSMAQSGRYIYLAGQQGVQRMEKENLLVDKIIFQYYEVKSIAAQDNLVAVALEDKVLLLDSESGELIKELPVKNLDLYNRRPAFDDNGNLYYLSDNKITKLNTISFREQNYSNPVPAGKLFSYDTAVLPEGEVYYANGYGLSKFDSNFQKTNWIYLGNQKQFGENSWTLGVEALMTQQGKRIVAFNKGSIILLDYNFNVLDQYTYESFNNNTFKEDPYVALSKEYPREGETIDVYVYGFWPNEEVEINLGEENKIIKVDSLGYAKTEMTVTYPEAKPYEDKPAVIKALGQKSNLSYQVAF